VADSQLVSGVLFSCLDASAHPAPADQLIKSIRSYFALGSLGPGWVSHFEDKYGCLAAVAIADPIELKVVQRSRATNVMPVAVTIDTKIASNP